MDRSWIIEANFQCIKEMYEKLNRYLLVYERQINHSHLDIPQVSVHTEQRDPAGINSALSKFHCRSITSSIYCDFLCLVLTYVSPPKLRCNEFKRGHPALKEQYPVTAHVPNFDFLTGRREFKRREESKAPFILRSLKWDRSEVDPRSVLRSVRDRIRTCSQWRLLIRQIIPNVGGLSSLFTLWLRVRWVAWHRLAFF